MARLVVEGFLTGLHTSPYHGFSAEFAEYRQYIPGEPVANIDWRVYAKTDRHYLKVFTEETNLRATCWWTARPAWISPATTTGRPRRPTPAYLAAALTYLLLRQNDAVGLVTFDEAPLARGAGPLHAPAALPGAEGAGRPARRARAPELGEVLHRVAERIQRRGLVLLLSDLMDDPEPVISGLKHFRHRGHEVVVFQILDPREVDLDFDGEVEFEALEEPGRRVRLEPAHLRDGYRAAASSLARHLRRECRRQLIDLVEITTDTPFERGLGAYLQKRRRMY